MSRYIFQDMLLDREADEQLDADMEDDYACYSSSCFGTFGPRSSSSGTGSLMVW